MPELQSIPPGVWAFVALLIALGVAIYTQLARTVARSGGKVRTDSMHLPELLISFVLASIFLLVIGFAIKHQGQPEKPLTVDSLIPSSLNFLILAGGIVLFLKFGRHLRLRYTFGIDQMHPLTAVCCGIGLCFASLPITHSAGLLSMSILKGNAAPQPLVELFSKVAREHDYASVFKIFLVGAVFAPCCEEFLFRGLCYGTWKRYIGRVGAGLIASLLFAAMHTSITAFASLFLLAICLTIAYERTGSLFVPIALHATFNALSLLVLLVQAQFPLPVTP